MFRRFLRDQQGVALVLVTVMLPVMMGFALLVIDRSRAFNLHSDLQKAADALALAGAAELDGKSDAITRAQRAMQNLIENQSRFSDAGPHLVAYPTDVTARYLKDLPAKDSDPIPATDVTTDPLIADFVEVTINPANFDSIFPASFLGTNGSFQISASAVAGATSGVCDFTPVFICNPYEHEPFGETLEEAVNTRAGRRHLIQLRTVGQGAGWGPGNFGFLDTGGNGAQSLALALASSKPQACYRSNGVTTETGQNAGKVKAAINIRFGISDPGGKFNSPEYGPAENVRKGATANGNTCPSSHQLTYAGPPSVSGLGVDACFSTGNCPYLGGRMGNGNWDFTSYWNVNHSGRSVPTELSGTGADLPTRYEVYHYEIDHKADGLLTDASPGGEIGTPSAKCQPAIPITQVDRRLIYGAVLNCDALEAAGYDLNGKSEDLPVEAFASFFMTQPVRTDRCTGSSTETCYDYDADIFVELVDVSGRSGRGTLANFSRDEVQLYR